MTKTKLTIPESVTQKAVRDDGYDRGVRVHPRGCSKRHIYGSSYTAHAPQFLMMLDHLTVCGRELHVLSQKAFLLMLHVQNKTK